MHGRAQAEQRRRAAVPARASRQGDPPRGATRKCASIARCVPKTTATAASWFPACTPPRTSGDSLERSASRADACWRLARLLRASTPKRATAGTSSRPLGCASWRPTSLRCRGISRSWGFARRCFPRLGVGRCARPPGDTARAPHLPRSSPWRGDADRLPTLCRARGLTAASFRGGARVDAAATLRAAVRAPRAARLRTHGAL